MSKPDTLIATLLRIKNEENGDINFKFADGTTQRQSINKQFFYDERNKPLDLYKVVQNINDICHDMHAVSFEVE